MIKFLLWLGIAVAGLALIAVGLNALLTPDDLVGCAAKPDTNSSYMIKNDSGINCQPADAVIAVSGGDTMSRAESAVKLYQDGWAHEIIFSGAARDPQSQSNAQAMRNFAIKSGVPDSAIVVEEISKNTTENAINTAKVLKKYKVKTAILTTSPYHLRRAGLEFKRAAPGVEFRTHPAADQSWNLWFLKPSGWWRALNELGGLVVFGVRGLF